jgi:hypothetical protein
MEAVANGQQAYRFSSELHAGKVYAFRGLGQELEISFTAASSPAWL